MLNKLRNFSKTKLATVLVAIIIIPFVFWGMGGVFQGGNSNNIAKIKNTSISTQDFFDHIRSLGISEEIISKNINDNILKELLNDLLAQKFIELEIKKLGITINDRSLLELIKNNKNFLDKDKKFNRLKYEKFLLENNISAPQFEKRLKKRELEKILFNFYSSGLYVPEYLVNFYNYSGNRIINVEYVSLESNYKKKDEFKKADVLKYIELNSEELKRDFIDIKYVKLTPENLTGITNYSEEYFSEIDKIEAEILNINSLEDLIKDYQDVQIEEIKELSQNKVKEDLEEVFNFKNNKLIQLLDKEEYFLVFKIENYKQKIPKLDDEFENEIKEILFIKNRFQYNQKIFSKINTKKFNDNDFNNTIEDKSKYKKGQIKSIKDNTTFEINSVELIYSMPINSFLLVTNDKEEVYLLKITDFKNIDLPSNKKELYKQTQDKIQNEIYSSYDQYLNKNYKVEINYNTLERTENYFK